MAIYHFLQPPDFYFPKAMHDALCTTRYCRRLSSISFDESPKTFSSLLCSECALCTVHTSSESSASVKRWDVLTYIEGPKGLISANYFSMNHTFHNTFKLSHMPSVVIEWIHIQMVIPWDMVIFLAALNPCFYSLVLKESRSRTVIVGVASFLKNELKILCAISNF